MNDETQRVRRGLGEKPPAAPNHPPAPEAGPAPTLRRGLGEPAPATPSAPAPATSSAQATPASGTAAASDASPRRNPVVRWLVLAAGLLVLAALTIIGARVLIGVPAVQDFLDTYRGEYPPPDGAPVGFPVWLSWAHFLNAFFLVLIIKTGWQVRTQRKPPASWVRDNTRWPRTKNPPRKISITLWLHLALDALWFLNGVAFVVLLIVTGHWVRVVPTSWEVVPNALSAALQYASLEWPTENGWVNYNSLQQLAYFVTIFIAAPLAAATGIRMSGAWPQDWTRLSRLYPVEVARAVHFPVMLYFVLFLTAHVTLVLATGTLCNLNHMYGGQDAVNWTGALIFAVSLLTMAGAWVAARPIVIAPIAGLFGKVGR
jgi:thiosulfate reductase cytochrome b subunit